MDLIFQINNENINLPHLSKVGGKGRALIETTQAGFQVPPFMVLSVDFFESWLNHIKRTQAWKRFVNIHCKELTNTCAQVKSECSRLIFDESQTKALLDSLNATFPDTNRNKKPLLVADRSSSPEEDLEGKSFAGGYETILGVRVDKSSSSRQSPQKFSDQSCQDSTLNTRKYNLANIMTAVRHCFASLFDECVVQYKLQVGIDITKPSIALVIQKQVASYASGVAFSLNPQNNCYDEVVINSNFGLGETVVSGDVTPDLFVVDKVKDIILEKKIATKSHAILVNISEEEKKSADDFSPSIITSTRFENSEESSLTDPWVMKVTEMCKKIELWYKKPMDIEWAIQEDSLYLLQARPITTHIPIFPELLTKPGDKKFIYNDMTTLAQGFNEPMSMLGADVFNRLAAASKEDFGLTRGRKNGVMFHLNGRQFVNLSYIMKIFSPEFVVGRIRADGDMNVAKALSALDLTKEYTPNSLPNELKHQKWVAALTMIKSAPLLITAFFSPDKAIVEFRKTINNIENASKQDPTEDESFSSVLHEAMGHCKILFNKAIMLAVPILINNKISKIFEGHGVDDLISAINMDLEGNPTSEMNSSMYELAHFAEIQDSTSEQNFLDMIKSKSCSEEFLIKYNAFMGKFGCRGDKEIDIGAPRYSENPGLLLRQLQGMDLENNPIASMKDRKRTAYKKLLNIAKTIGKEKKFNSYYNIVSKMMGYREQTKFMWVVLLDKLRKHALKIGTKMFMESRLHLPEDIFCLEVDDIIAAESDPSFDLISIVEKYRALLKNMEQVQIWPSIFDSRGQIFRAPLEKKDDCIFGQAISTGKVCGRAKILNSPNEKPLLKGEILVARSTNPGWSPIFVNAAGIVMEVGGALNHGAIIARGRVFPVWMELKI